MGIDEAVVFEAVVDRLVDVVFVLGDDDELTWRRRSPRQRLALSGDDVIGAPMFDRIHPDDLPGVLTALEQLREGEVTTVELSARVYDASDPMILHDEDIHAFDARDEPEIGGVVVAAVVRDTRRALADQVHGDDFSLADVAPVGLAIVATNGRLVYANDPFREHLGLGERSAVTATAVEGLHDLLDAARNEAIAEGILTHRGRTLRTIGQKFGDGAGNIAVSTTDVSAEHEALAARRRSEQTWRAAFDHAPAGIALVSLDGVFEELNPGWCAITGYDAESLVGRGFAEITHPDDLEADEAYVQELLRGERATYRMQKRYFHQTGQLIWVDLWVALVRGPDEEPIYFVSQILDITEAKQVEADMLARHAELTRDATHDHLTGLANGALLDEHLRVAICRADRRSDRAALLRVALGGLGSIVERFGRGAADEVLVEVADRLTAACRSGDIVARTGVEEFAIITETDDAASYGALLADRVAAVLTQPLDATPQPTSVVPSIGVTVIGPGDTAASVRERAAATRPGPGSPPPARP